MTWQGRNRVDEDGDGEPDLLDRGDAVGLHRVLAGGALPAGFVGTTAPLLAWLDHTHRRYDVTTDVALARGHGPRLAGHAGVLLAGDVRWLPADLQRALRRFVTAGGTLAAAGTDDLRRQVRLTAGDRLTDPTPPAPASALGLRPGPLLRADTLTLTNLRDDLRLFAGSSGELRGFRVAEPLRGVAGRPGRELGRDRRRRDRRRGGGPLGPWADDPPRAARAPRPPRRPHRGSRRAGADGTDMGAAVALIALAAVAAAALVLERPRAKAWAVLATGALVPVALGRQRWGLADGRWLRDHPAALAAGRRGRRRRVAAPRAAVRAAPRRAAGPGRGGPALPAPGGGPGRPRGAGRRALRRRGRRRGGLRGGAPAPRPVARRRAPDPPRPAHPGARVDARGRARALRRPGDRRGGAATRPPARSSPPSCPSPCSSSSCAAPTWTPGLVRTCAAVLAVVAAVPSSPSRPARRRRDACCPRRGSWPTTRLADAFRASSLVFDPDALGRLLAVVALLVTGGAAVGAAGAGPRVGGPAARRCSGSAWR